MRPTHHPRFAGLVLLLVFAAGCDYVERASVDTAGGDPNGASLDSSISADGRYVAFWSSAGDLVPGDDNSVNDVFVRDLRANTTTRVSVDTAGGRRERRELLPDDQRRRSLRRVRLQRDRSGRR